MVYVFRKAASAGARELAESLPVNARKIADLSRAHFGHGVRSGDIVICWGERLDAPAGVRVLNGGPVTNKFQDALKLKQAGVPTVEVSQTRPLTTNPTTQLYPRFDDLREMAQLFTRTPFDRTGPVYRRAIEQFQQELSQFSAFLVQPVPPPAPAENWIPRLNNHVGGNDLLRPNLTTPDYYSKKLDIVEEYRIHSFQGKSIRAGIKKLREGYTLPQRGQNVNGDPANRIAHSWVRSYDGGWRIVYDEFKSKKAMRELAAKAVESLGLQFGAVDIGKTRDNKLVVLEVNRAPGLEGGTVDAYARAIGAWVQEGR